MTYKHIRSLSRGIEVLRYLNTVDGAHPSDICRSLDLPRPTVHRILETLGELTLSWSAQHWSDDSLASLGADYDA